LLRIVLGGPKRFQFLRKEHVAKSCWVGRETVAVTSFSSLLAADLVDPVASVVATVCVAGDMAICVASASAITAATSSSVTTLSEIIPYYRLNHSIWSLSDNKESSCWVLPDLRPVNHLKHTERIKCMH
jgi:hypothetical protein